MTLLIGQLTVSFLRSTSFIELRPLINLLFLLGYLMAAIFLIFLSVRAIKKGYRPARYFSFSVILFFTTTLLFFIDVLGFIKFNEPIFMLTSVSVFGGSLFLTRGLLMMAKYNTTKKQKAVELFRNYLLLKNRINVLLKIENEMRFNQKELEELHEEQSQRLMEKEKHFKYLVENLSDWVWQINSEREFTYNNFKLQKLLDYRVDELFHKPIIQLIEPNDRFRFEKAVSTCLSEGKGFIDLPVQLLDKNNLSVPVEISGEVIRDYKNKIIGILGISRDLRQKRISEQVLLKAIHDAEENERKRLATEIHDGIGPILSGINLYLSTWLLHRISPEKQRELIDKTKKSILYASQELIQIANNLMPAEFINYTLIENISMLVHRMCPNNEISLSIITKDFPEKLTDDQKLVIYRIISELFTNTLKHANARKVSITFTSEDNTAKISYSDNGIGFDVSEMTKHFDGLGLRNIHSRLKTLNSIPYFSSSSGNGMTLDFSFQITDDSNCHQG